MLAVGGKEFGSSRFAELLRQCAGSSANMKLLGDLEDRIMFSLCLYRIQHRMRQLTKCLCICSSHHSLLLACSRWKSLSALRCTIFGASDIVDYDNFDVAFCTVADLKSSNLFKSKGYLKFNTIVLEEYLLYNMDFELTEYFGLNNSNSQFIACCPNMTADDGASKFEWQNILLPQGLKYESDRLIYFEKYCVQKERTHSSNLDRPRKRFRSSEKLTEPPGVSNSCSTPLPTDWFENFIDGQNKIGAQFCIEYNVVIERRHNNRPFDVKMKLTSQFRVDLMTAFREFGLWCSLHFIECSFIPCLNQDCPSERISEIINFCRERKSMASSLQVTTSKLQVLQQVVRNRLSLDKGNVYVYAPGSNLKVQLEGYLQWVLPVQMAKRIYVLTDFVCTGSDAVILLSPDAGFRRFNFGNDKTYFCLVNDYEADENKLVKHFFGEKIYPKQLNLNVESGQRASRNTMTSLNSVGMDIFVKDSFKNLRFKGEIITTTNSVACLNEICQKEKWGQPSYKISNLPKYHFTGSIVLPEALRFAPLLLDMPVSSKKMVKSLLALKCLHRMQFMGLANSSLVQDNNLSEVKGQKEISPFECVSLLYHCISSLRNGGYPEFSYDQSDGGFVATVKLPLCMGIPPLSNYPTPSKRDAKRHAAILACHKLQQNGYFKEINLPVLGETSYGVDPVTDASSSPSQKNRAIARSATTSISCSHKTIASKIVSNAISCGAKKIISRFQCSSENSTGSCDEIPKKTAKQLGLICFYEGYFNFPGDTIEVHFYGIENRRLAILTLVQIPWKAFPAMKILNLEGWNRNQVPFHSHHTVVISKDQLRTCLSYHAKLIQLLLEGLEKGLESASSESERDILSFYTADTDMGYIFVPLLPDGQDRIDFQHSENVLSQPVLRDAWNQSDEQSLEKVLDDSLLTPENRYKSIYQFRAVSNKTISDGLRERSNPENSLLYWKDLKASKKQAESEGVDASPILGRWYRNGELDSANQKQFLVHGSQLPSSFNVFYASINEADNTNQHLKQRLLVPEHCFLLQFPCSIYREGMEMLSLLLDFEWNCQVYNLKRKITEADVSLVILRQSMERPLYERLETLGDCFLKLEASWYVFQTNKSASEGTLTTLRSEIVSNSSLRIKALEVGLQKYIIFPNYLFKNKGWQYWRPSSVYGNGKQLPLMIANKCVADVVEALIGAFLSCAGEDEARTLFKWIGLPVCQEPATASPTGVFKMMGRIQLSSLPEIKSPANNPGLLCAMGMGDRLKQYQALLNYTFQNESTLLEATTFKKSNKSSLNGSFDRLEFLGDALIDYLALSFSFNGCVNGTPQDLHLWKSLIVSNDNMAGIGKSLFKIPYLFFNTNTGDVNKTCADILEATAAAVFIDSGHDFELLVRIFFIPLVANVKQKLFNKI